MKKLLLSVLIAAFLVSQMAFAFGAEPLGIVQGYENTQTEPAYWFCKYYIRVINVCR